MRRRFPWTTTPPRLSRAGRALCLACGLLLGSGLGGARAAGDDDAGAAPRYVIRQVLLQGASAYKPATLEAVYAPALARPVSDADVAALADAVADFYHRGGYFLATAAAPKQRLDYGLLVMRVAEGDITAVRVEGDRALYTAPLRAAAQRLLSIRPPTEGAFAQAMAAFSAVPGMATDIRFLPDPAGPGHYVLVLDLQRRAAPVVQASLGAGADDVTAAGELATDLMPSGPLVGADRYGPDAPVRRATPAIGPFYVPRPDGRQDAYTLLDHGPGWYKRSEDQSAVPAALGVRLRDDDTKVGFEAGIPYDNRVDGVRSRNGDEDLQVLFTVDRHF